MSLDSKNREKIIANALLRALKRNKSAFVLVATEPYSRVTIDGTYSVTAIARAIDQAIQEESTHQQTVS